MLTAKEFAILSLLRRRVEEDGIVPTVREICAHLQIKSTSTVHRCLDGLESKGFITRESGRNRAIRVNGPRISRVPIVGTVTAGQPILATQLIEDYVPFSGDGEGLFALHVKGDSMIDAGILDGDLVIVRRCSSAQNGEIVVAMIDDEATVKRFYKENGQYRLQPENSSLQPIFCSKVDILGKVIALHRQY